MSFFGRLFGSERALSKVVDGVSNGLDALVYTDEEKAKDSAEATTEARRMVVEWMKATQGQNLARRLIALSVTMTWLLQYIIAHACSIISVWSLEPERWEKASNIMLQGSGAMTNAVMLILGFYFAAPYMGDIARHVLKPKENKA